MDDTLDTAIWLAILVAAVGTYLVRAVPLWWMQRHLARRSQTSRAQAMPVWLSVLGPAMIAAMLGVSLVPGSFTLGAAAASIAGVALTLLVWRRTRSLGWPVLVGVAIYGAVTLVFGG